MSVTFKLRPEAKFADGTPITADDVVFTFNILKEKGHPAFAMSLRDVVKAEALDPQTVRYDFKGDLMRDLPVDRRRACRSSRRPTTPRTHSTSRRSNSRSAPAPTRSATSSPAPRQLQAPPRLLGQGSARQSRPLQLRRSPLRVLSRPHARARRSEVRRLRLPRGIHLHRLGHRLRHSSRQGRPVMRLTLPDRAPIGRARVLHQYAPRTSSRTSACARRSARLRLRMDEQESVLRSLQAHAELLRELRHEGDGPAVAEELALLEPFKDKLAPEVFGEPSRRR